MKPEHRRYITEGADSDQGQDSGVYLQASSVGPPNELHNWRGFFGEIILSKLAWALLNRASDSVWEIKVFTMFLHELVVLCFTAGGVCLKGHKDWRVRMEEQEVLVGRRRRREELGVGHRKGTFGKRFGRTEILM